jgi:hypothetical protein
MELGAHGGGGGGGDEGDEAVVAALRQVIAAGTDGAEGQGGDGDEEAWVSAGQDAVQQRSGREAVAQILWEYATSDVSSGEVADPRAFDNLARLFAAALDACSSHGDASTVARYVKTMDKVFVLGAEDEPCYLADVGAVLRSTLWSNFELLEEVAWEALCVEKERTMAAFDTREMDDAAQAARAVVEQGAAFKAITCVLSHAVRGGAASIDEAHAHIERLRRRELLVEPAHVETLGQLVAAWTMDRLLGRRGGVSDEDWAASPHNRGQSHDEYGFQINADNRELYIASREQAAKRAAKAEAQRMVSRSCAWIGSPCLRNYVHGASIGVAGVAGRRAGRAGWGWGGEGGAGQPRATGPGRRAAGPAR